MNGGTETPKTFGTNKNQGYYESFNYTRTYGYDIWQRYGIDNPAVERVSRTGYLSSPYYNTLANGTGQKMHMDNSKTAQDMANEVGKLADFKKRNIAVNLYITWIPNTYQVKYNANGGSGSMSNSSHTYDVAKKLTKNTFTRTGYIFSGWATSASGNKVHNDEASVINLSSKNNDVVNLYAKWTAITYQVKYNANGGSGSMSNSSHTYDVAKKLTKNTFTRTGYTFSGWATSASGNKVHNDEASVTNLSSKNNDVVNLYAKWTAITYQVRYNANDGSGSMSNSHHTYDVAKNLTANAFTREGYTFTGWATSSSGDEIYNNQASVVNLSSTNGDIVDLYAKWSANTYEITLDGWNVPILTIGNRVYGYSSTTKPSTYDGEYVVTWARTIDGASSDTNDIAISGLDSMMSDNATYRLRFKYKAASNAGGRLNVFRTGDSSYISIIRGSREYTDVYIDDLTKTNAKLIYLRTFYPTSGDKYYFSNFELHPMVTYNTDFTFPKLTKTGYTFSGWYGSEGTRVTDGSGNMLFGVSGYTNSFGRWGRASNTTLYRRWAPNVYKVTFNKQSGSGGTSNIYYKFNQSSPYYYYYDKDCTSGVANYKITIPTRKGYTFKGYFTSTGGSGTQYVDSSGTCINNMYLTAGDKTLYAYWEANTIKITLDLNGGYVASTYMFYYKYGIAKYYRDSDCTTEITKVSFSTFRNGYTLENFQGDGSCGGNDGEWFVNSSGGFASDLHTDIYKDATLYAKWTKLAAGTGSATAHEDNMSGQYSGYRATVKCGAIEVDFSYMTTRGGTSCSVNGNKVPGQTNKSISFTNVVVTTTDLRYTVSWNASTLLVTIKVEHLK